MKLSNRSTVLAALILAIVAACALAGCAASPVRKVAVAQQGYAATLNLLTDLRTAGKISDAEAVKIEAALIVVDNAFAEARAKALAGDKVGADDALAVALKSLADVNQFLSEHRR